MSNYYHFRRFFGIWTFISVSVVYDTAVESYFPPMVRFEINDKKMPIIGPLKNLAIGEISFSEHLFALVRSLKVYKTYLIGTNTFEMNTNEKINPYNKIDDYLVKPITGLESFFDVVSDESECLLEKFGITAYDKEIRRSLRFF